MSSKSRKKITSAKLKAIPTISLHQAYEEKLLPDNFHLADSIDMKQYHKKHQNDWWIRMSKAYERQ